MVFADAIPLLLSFLIGLLIGILAAGLLPSNSRTANRALIQDRRDSLVWLMLLAAFTFGILITIALSGLS